MSFYDDASIVMIPSGYKAGKLYSAKPTDGSGDLSFTRTGATATRVNESGLIERCRTNQMLRSEELDNASWAKENIAVTANSVANPLNGLVNADKLTATVTGNSAPLLSQGVGSLSSQVATISGYFKKSEYNFLVIHAFGLAGTVFNLNTGVVVSGSGTITLVGDGWYRCAAVFNVTSTALIYLTPSSAGAISGPTTAGSGIFAFGIQGEQGDIATAYIPTTSAAVTVGPIANVPRLDYTGGGCPKLLMEPTRTNLLKYSESINDANWTKQNATILSNQIIGPDGYTNADKFVASATNAFHAIYNGAATYTGTYTISIFAKKAEYAYLIMLDQFSNRFRVSFNLDTKVITKTVGIDASIVEYGNGWSRFIITWDAAGVSVFPSFLFSNSLGVDTYLGDGVSGGYLWGAQLEAGSYATSYIPTFNASVTRNADSASKTGISSLIGQTEGTIFVDIKINNPLSIVNRIFSITESEWVTGGSIRIDLNSTSATLDVVNNSTSVASIIGNKSFSINTNYKFAIAYKENNCVLYVNGEKLGEDLITGIMPTCLNFYLNELGGTFSGNTYEANSFNQSIIFKTRLSNSELATLTTL